MTFYFVSFVLLGLVNGSTLKQFDARKTSFLSVPKWVHGPYADFAGFIAQVSWIPATLTIWIKYEFKYALLTFGEIALGVFLAIFLLPRPLQIVLLGLAPIINLVILGALWGWWYI